ncbi:MAG: FMN-dependent NADH-azoreductase [Fulvimarina manganoxydans]|uniref:FMN-dependent NADH-azoreductase n=1 Tax=Fulvimarina manganoxydans TaxID=937218 RepID=UPI0023528D61|nr:FMN-dependent NADH-azoreductase [Fulvimarina manganoxydans]MCK5932698.1 FMN-dependent NADH-azoreductase [Fulvimarina manganoxydans]
MSTVLVLNSSVLSDASVSRQLVAETVSSLRNIEPSIRVIERDLAADPVPHFGPDAAVGVRGTETMNTAQATARTLSDELLNEVREAGTLVIGAPMYNFGIPSTLKSWFDYILRPGIAFRYSDAGPEGLLKGKRAIVILSRGGLYSEGPAAPMDSQQPHLRTLLGFVGITDVTFILAEKLGLGPEAREISLQAATRQIELAIAHERAEAA